MRVVDAVEQLGRQQQGLVPASTLRRVVSRTNLSRAASSGRVVVVRPRVYSLAALPTAGRHLVTEAGPCPDWVAAVRAALLSTKGSVAAGRTAAVLRGWGLLVEPRRQVELVVPHGRGAVVCPGARVRQVRGPAVAEVVAVAGHRAAGDPGRGDRRGRLPGPAPAGGRGRLRQRSTRQGRQRSGCQRAAGRAGRRPGTAGGGLV